METPPTKVTARRAKVWSSEDVRLLRISFGSTPDEDLAEQFGCTAREVVRKATSLALSKSKSAPPGARAEGPVKMPRWPPEDIERLRAAYPTTPNLAIALELGRSVKSVNSKARHLGLHKDQARIIAMGRENVKLRRDRERL